MWMINTILLSHISVTWTVVEFTWWKMMIMYLCIDGQKGSLRVKRSKLHMVIRVFKLETYKLLGLQLMRCQSCSKAFRRVSYSLLLSQAASSCWCGWQLIVLRGSVVGRASAKLWSLQTACGAALVRRTWIHDFPDIRIVSKVPVFIIWGSNLPPPS